MRLLTALFAYPLEQSTGLFLELNVTPKHKYACFRKESKRCLRNERTGILYERQV